MSKNMTRKGLAFGLGLALVTSTFAGAPAFANGQADKTLVSLAPRVGTEYAVLTDQYFDLSSNVVGSLQGVAGKDLKFLVSDPLERVFVDQSQQTSDAASNSTDLGLSYANSGTVTTLTVDASNDSTANLDANSKHILFGLASTSAVGGTAFSASSLNGRIFTVGGSAAETATNAEVNFGGSTVASIAVTGGAIQPVIGLNSRAAILANGALDNDLFESATITTSISGKTISNGRATDGTFVVNTETNSNSANRLLRLVTNSSTTYSVDVTAWVDDNDNGLIDATEYTSPTRTVTFQAASGLVPTTTISPIVGDPYLTATITTTPVLNGQQVLAQNPGLINADFTRQDSTATRNATADWTGVANQTSTWNDTAKSFTVRVGLRVTTGADDVSGAWTGLTSPAGATSTQTITGSSSSIATTGVATITSTSHGLRVGDKVTFASTGQATLNGVRTVTSVPSANTFTVNAETKPASAVATLSDGTYTVTTYTQTNSIGTGTSALGNVALVDRVFAGTYSARATIGATAAGNTATASTAAAISAGATISTVGSASVQGKSFDQTQTSTNTTLVKTGTLSVPVSVAVVDVDGDPVGSGRSVAIALTATGTADTFRVNGKTSDVLTTDANGRVSMTITAAFGRTGALLNVTATAENAVSADIDLEWAAASFGLVDLATTGGSLASTTHRSIPERGSYTLNLAVMDQWFQAPAAGTYRLALTGEGVTAGVVNLTDGRGSVVISDAGVDADANLATTITLQKMTTAGTVESSTAFTVNTALTKTAAVRVGANGSTLFSSSAARLTAGVAEKALVEVDRRVSSTTVPAYGTDKFVRITGQVVNAASAAGLRGAVVTVTGPSNVLFLNAGGEVYKRGTLTFVSSAAGDANDGRFEIHAFSTTAQTDTTITITANGVSNTVKISFTGTGVGEGTKLDVTVPANVKPASTFQVKAKLSDEFGNGVDTAANRVRVTYTGPGIVFGTLPNETDRNGELSFSVLLGSNDTGNIVVTVSYDQNGDADYVDAKDLNTTKTIVVGTGAAAGTGGTGKVNVGSFNGRLVVYAANLNGKRISWKVNGRWGSAVADSNFDSFNRPTPRAGATVSVEIYVDGVKTLTKSVVTR